MGQGAWRLLEHPAGSAAANMAVDEALLLSAAHGPPTLRLYTWLRPAVSLGYRQRAPAWLERCAGLGVEVVRRVSGGGTVLHAGDLTYAVVAPLGTAVLPDDLHGSYAWIRSALLDGLRELGVCARPSEGQPAAARLDVCFAGATGFEIEVEGRKLVGSAQRRTAWGFLQHGSLRLGDDSGLYAALLGSSPGPAPLAAPPAPQAAAAALIRAFSRALAGDLVPGALSPREQTLAGRLQELRRRDTLAIPGLSLTRFTYLADSAT